MASFVDKTGKRYGMLEVIELAPKRGNKNYWVCRCDCGNVVEIDTSSLRDSGGSKACGCRNKPKRIPGRACESPTAKYPGGRTGTHAGWMAHYASKEDPCEPCRLARNSNTAKWRAANENTAFDYHLRTRFRITVEDYFAILEAQGGGCAICGSKYFGTKKLDRFHVDHDHACCPEAGWSCGKCVRGLLCHGCNTALGNFNDNAERLGKAIEYLNAGGTQIELSGYAERRGA